ncbi:hypothetical protein [Deinococcus sp. YIM 77859]|uniref:hypothetical protein n=1 Tax=Deinococcus sp. YIM 77859 TaxID=1540221 RepID=UPI00054F7186|nr:hypothetical protein [Deinococcus sp. YIM 77859]
MKFFARVALVAALALGAAGAQDLGAYRTLARSLDAAAAAGSGEQALMELDQAEAAYAQLAPTVENRQLLGELRSTLDRARGALARTPAEVQAQVLLARGLLRRALYDQTLEALAQHPDHRAQLRLLAREFGLSADEAQALAQDAAAGQLERVAWRLQRSAARQVNAALQAARPQRNAAAYLNLARGASWLTALQNAGGTQTLRAEQFTAALKQLTAGDVPALTASLTGLRQGAGALVRSLATPPQLAAPAKPMPASSEVPAVAAAEVAPPAPAQQESLDATYAALARALTAAGHGDPETARQALSRALLAVPPSLREAAGYAAFVQNLTAAQERRGLRPEEVQALMAELGGLESGTVPTVDALSASTSRTFSGGLRATVFLGLALLALVPLYLLHLAFGSRNPAWRAITAALALLLLPLFVEGVFGFLGWLGDLSGVPLLRAALSLTLEQGAYGLPLRVLLMTLAVALASWGFWSLCVQFGLLGRPQGRRSGSSLEWDEEPI